MKVKILDEKINDLVEKAEEAGNAGDLEEAQVLPAPCYSLLLLATPW